MTLSQFFLLSLFYLILFSIANDCFVNLSDLSKMLVNRNKLNILFYLLWSCTESSGFTRTIKFKNEYNLYAEGLDDNVITEMINMLCNEW